MTAAQPNSQNRVQLAWLVTLTFTCLLLSPAPAHADGSTERHPQSTQYGLAPSSPRGSRVAPPQSQDPVPLTKEVLINRLELKREEMLELKRGGRRKPTLEEFLDSVQKEVLDLVQNRGVTFRLMPAEEREIRKAGDYLSAGGLEKLINALQSERNYRPETTLRGVVEQVRVTDEPGGGIYVFIRLAVTNAGPQSSPAQNFKLRVMPTNSQSFVMRGGEPAQTIEPFKVPDDGRAGAVLIGPEDNLVKKTQTPIRSRQTVTGWLRFRLQAIRMPNRPPLTPEYLRQPGVWYILSFDDFAGRPYEAVYKMK